MKNIYLETIEAIENDIDVRVDILKRTLIVNKEVVIGNGCFDGNLGLPEMPIKKALQIIEDACIRYKYSMPMSEQGKRKKNNRSLFKAAGDENLSNESLMWGGEYRNIAQCRLELTVLIFILNKSLNPNDDIFKGKWFWQSDKDKELVILKKWIV